MKKLILSLFFCLSCCQTSTPAHPPQPSGTTTGNDKPHSTVDIDANKFELTTFLLDKNSHRLAIFANDSLGGRGHAIFVMPDLSQEQEYEEVLVVKRNDQKYVIGTTQNPGVANAQTSLCANEYAAKCDAQIHLKDGVVESLQIRMSDQTLFRWPAL